MWVHNRSSNCRYNKSKGGLECSDAGFGLCMCCDLYPYRRSHATQPKNQLLTELFEDTEDIVVSPQESYSPGKAAELRRTSQSRTLDCRAILFNQSRNTSFEDFRRKIPQQGLVQAQPQSYKIKESNEKAH